MRALDLIIEQQNHVDSQHYVESLQKLVDQFHTAYSDRSKTLVFDSKGPIEDAMDAYFQAQQSVSEWCGVAADRFQAFLQLVQNFSLAKAKLQQKIVIPVLEEAKVKFSAVNEKLDQASRYFAKASEAVASLIAQLNIDFNDQSGNMSKIMQRLYKTQTCGFRVCWNRKPTSQIERLKKELENHLAILKLFNEDYNLRNALVKTSEKVIVTKNKLKEELQTIGDAETQAQGGLDTIRAVNDIDELSDVIQNEIQASAEKLIAECKNYNQQYIAEKKSYYEALDAIR